MKHAEMVTFGGSAFDRAAHLRGNAEAMAELRSHADATCVLLWRGKIAVVGAGDGDDTLCRVGMGHKIVPQGPETLIFLGLEETGAPCFACDLSEWEPVGQDLSGLNSFVDATRQSHPDLPEGHGFAELRRIMSGLTRRDAELAATAKALFGWHASHGFCACCGHRTHMAEAGWQRICPSCRASHFPRTDPVVIMLITHEDSVLMGRSPGWPEGMYSLLAGFVEPGETLEAAVRREVLEEAGIPVGEVQYLSSQPWPFPTSLMFGCAGQALAREIRIDPTEIEDARWLSRAEMMQVFAGEHGDLKPARKGSIAHFLLENWLADTLD